MLEGFEAVEVTGEVLEVGEEGGEEGGELGEEGLGVLGGEAFWAGQAGLLFWEQAEELFEFGGEFEVGGGRGGGFV